MVVNTTRRKRRVYGVGNAAKRLEPPSILPESANKRVGTSMKAAITQAPSRIAAATKEKRNQKPAHEVAILHITALMRVLLLSHHASEYIAWKLKS